LLTAKIARSDTPTINSILFITFPVQQPCLRTKGREPDAP
jgi:hypothetical protein